MGKKQKPVPRRELSRAEKYAFLERTRPLLAMALEAVERNGSMVDQIKSDIKGT